MKNFHSDYTYFLIRIVGKDEIPVSIFKRTCSHRRRRHFANAIMANYYTWKSYQCVSKIYHWNCNSLLQCHIRTYLFFIVTIPVSHVTGISRFVWCVIITWIKMSVDLNVEICSRETLCMCSAENCGKNEIDNKATNFRKMYFAIWFNYIEACHQSVFFQYVRYLGSICFIGTHLEIMLCQVRFAGSKLFVTSFKSFSTNNKYKHPCELNV